MLGFRFTVLQVHLSLALKFLQHLTDNKTCFLDISCIFDKANPISLLSTQSSKKIRKTPNDLFMQLYTYHIIVDKNVFGAGLHLVIVDISDDYRQSTSARHCRVA